MITTAKQNIQPWKQYHFSGRRKAGKQKVVEIAFSFQRYSRQRMDDILNVRDKVAISSCMTTGNGQTWKKFYLMFEIFKENGYAAYEYICYSTLYFQREVWLESKTEKTSGGEAGLSWFFCFMVGGRYRQCGKS